MIVHFRPKVFWLCLVSWKENGMERKLCYLDEENGDEGETISLYCFWHEFSTVIPYWEIEIEVL